MNYTKGPWENGTVGDRADRNGRQIYAKKVNLATCHYGGTDTPCVEESSANARLIAAAPEMYEACHAAVVALTAAISDFQTDDDDAIIEDAFKKLNAALAKAEGRSEE